MEYQFNCKLDIKPGDLVKRDGYPDKLYLIAEDNNSYYLVDLQSGEIEDYGSHTMMALVETTKVKLMCRNEDMYITNRK